MTDSIVFTDPPVRRHVDTSGLFVVLHTVAGGERRSEQVEVPIWVRVDDIVVMSALPEFGRAGVPTGKFVGTSLRLRRAGEIDVMESPERIIADIHKALFPQPTVPTSKEPS